MALKAVIDNLDDAPEELRTEYVQGDDGKFHLDLDSTVSNHRVYVTLRNTVANLKREKADLQTKIGDLSRRIENLPEDFDPEKYQDALTELEALKRDPNRNKENEEQLQQMRERYEQRLRDAEAKRVADLAAKDQEIAEREGTIDNLVRGEGLTKALVKAGVSKEFLNATKAMLSPTIKVKRNEDTGQPEAIVETDMGEVPVEQYVDNWAKSDEGKPFVKQASGGAASGSGNGGGGSGEVNPWDPKTRNLTQQGEILRNDRQKAKRLMEKAGVSASMMSAQLGG